MNFSITRRTFCAAAVVSALSVATATQAQAPAFKITRASLAQNAAFTVAQSGTAGNRLFKVEVKGNKARVDYDDPNAGLIRYVANPDGFFLYTAGNKVALKQSVAGGVEGALQFAFEQVREQLAGTRKLPQKATVSGQPTDVYENKKTGVLVYLGTRPGFRLPVKTVQQNEGGKNTLLVTNIKINPVLADTRFDLPKDTQYVDSDGKPLKLPARRK